MFPAIRPWPMTLPPTNEGVRCDNHTEKTFLRKKINHHNLGGHERCKDSITNENAYDFVRVGELIDFYGQ